MNKFNYNLDFKTTDFRKNPELYRIGVGEQGVLLVEPYKSELLPLWRFKTVELAKESSKAIFAQFEKYLQEKDFVGADMACKYLQMGFTRARRYANHASGQKYAQNKPGKEAVEYPYSSGSKFKDNEVLPQEADAMTNEKAQVAQIFKEAWFRAKDNAEYKALKKWFREKYYKPDS